MKRIFSGASRYRRVLWTLTILAATLAAHTAAESKPVRSGMPDTLPPLKVIDPAYMDRTVNVCVDFFQFANGGWYTHDTIPAAYSSSGVGRDMSDRNEIVVQSVLDDVMRRRNALPSDSTPHKLGVFYATCMDSTASERAGSTSIRPWLAAIDAVQDKAGLLPAIATAQLNGTNVAFDYHPEANLHNATRYIANLSQAGLGLPDRDYYTKTDPESASTRRFYVKHITKLLTLAGEAATSASKDATTILALETEMAKAMLTRVELRDPTATDHQMSLADLQAKMPNISWAVYFEAAGLTDAVTTVNVSEPAFFERLNALMDSVPLAVWKAYLRYHAIENSAGWLSTPFVREDFAFSSHFSGTKALLPRWKRCGHSADKLLGEALGEAYVATTFSPQARARAKEVIDDIRTAFGERLKKLAWMSDVTRAEALHKLERMGEKVGYPDRWRDYTRLESAEGPFVLNRALAHRFEWLRVVNRPGTPIDTQEWGITVPTVNAYYDESKNEMVYPAGALVPQTFDPNADDAANYGSLGGNWAGHELTHGFDDEGRHYDADGNLRDWWQPADSVTFTAETDKIVAQFNAYIQVGTVHVNGKLTEGENIADYGGVLTGFDALQRAIERHGRPGPIDGFSPEQRYFISYAQGWRVHARDATLKTRVVTDPHAPEKWRVNGPLSNSAEFAKAFSCKSGDPMVRPPASVPQIW